MVVSKSEGPIPFLVGRGALEKALESSRDFPLSKELSERLCGEYKEARKNVIAVLRKGQPNHEIKDPDYMHPTINTNSNVPVNQENGTVRYYLAIMDALERALIYGKISENVLPPRAPQYLQDLVK